MRGLVLSLLATQTSLAVAQDFTSRFLTRTSLPEPTPSGDAPLDPAAPPSATGEPCGAIANIAADASSTLTAVDAELAYQCLQSVPISQDAAVRTLNGIINMVQFQSNLAYLANPPRDYSNDGVDLVAGLNDLRGRVEAGDFSNEFDFEAALSALLVSTYDGHLAFDAYTYSGAFIWRRSTSAALISGSSDGGLPQIYVASDANNQNRSPVEQINGRPVLEVLAEEAAGQAYHDPDTRWNALFVLQPAESSGFFISPPNYPGPELTMTFGNGTERSWPNAAIISDPSAWVFINSGQDFFERFVDIETASVSSLGKRSTPHTKTTGIPRRLRIPRDADITTKLLRDGAVPETYPSPFVEHNAADVPLAGFFPEGLNVGVLVIQTFLTLELEDAREFQQVIESFIAEAQNRNVERVIVDVRTNGGGKIFLGYEAYRQFFPNSDPYGANRFRIHEGSEIFGSSLAGVRESILTLDFTTSPFYYSSWVNQEGERFNSWDDMNGPVEHNSDSFTEILRYNLTDQYLVEDETYGIGLTITGYGDRSNFTEPPFPAENIVILSDGVCASTCAIFVEFMARQSGVRTVTIGGRPQEGPTQAVGGTKGSSVLYLEYLASLGSEVIRLFGRDQASSWRNVLPVDFGIAPLPQGASVNFQDTIRAGTEDEGIPTQFVNDTSSCRLWYTPEMYFDVEQVWGAVAEAVWGNNGQLDTSRCVGGSTTNEASTVGANPNGQGIEGGDADDAALSLSPRFSMMLLIGLATLMVTIM